MKSRPVVLVCFLLTVGASIANGQSDDSVLEKALCKIDSRFVKPTESLKDWLLTERVVTSRVFRDAKALLDRERREFFKNRGYKKEELDLMLRTLGPDVYHEMLRKQGNENEILLKEMTDNLSSDIQIALGAEKGEELMEGYCRATIPFMGTRVLESPEMLVFLKAPFAASDAIAINEKIMEAENSLLRTELATLQNALADTLPTDSLKILADDLQSLFESQALPPDYPSRP